MWNIYFLIFLFIFCYTWLISNCFAHFTPFRSKSVRSSQRSSFYFLPTCSNSWLSLPSRIDLFRTRNSLKSQVLRQWLGWCRRTMHTWHRSAERDLFKFASFSLLRWHFASLWLMTHHPIGFLRQVLRTSIWALSLSRSVFAAKTSI